MKEDREKVRRIVGIDDFFEIYVKCPLEICEKRDVKGLYKLAREGKIKNYTGVSAPYEEPEHPDLVIESSLFCKEECVRQILEFIESVCKKNN
jgi:adenylylsulfate kinase